MRRRYLGVGALAAAALLVLPASASADSLEAARNGVLGHSVAINSLWVIVAGLLVMFMQAGFAFLEIGFSRARTRARSSPKILINFSIAALAWYACGFAFAFGTGKIIGDYRVLPPGLRRSADGVSRDGAVRRHDRVEVLLPVRLLRGLAGDRLGNHPRADQVRGLRDLRGDLRRTDLSDRRPLGVRWRLAADEHRHAGLRRLDGGPPDRRDRRSGDAAAARRPARASTATTGSRVRSRGTRCPCSGSGC